MEKDFEEKLKLASDPNWKRHWYRLWNANKNRFDHNFWIEVDISTGFIEQSRYFAPRSMMFEHLDQFYENIHPDQWVYLKAIENSMQRSMRRLDFYRVDLPLKFPNDIYYLVRQTVKFRKNSWQANFMYHIIGIYEGEPLNPTYKKSRSVSKEETLNLREREFSLKYLLKYFEEETNLPFPFPPRFLKLMKYFFENPKASAVDAAEAFGHTESTIDTYRKQMMILAKETFPQYKKFQKPTTGSKRYVETKVLSEYWYNQGIAFEIPE